ncbi:MAG TPA: EAL domain-containing protein [Rectinemataceae bacterium]|nr:EAL domain-containing protein [Rectinemataceae bacterium]
MKRSDSGGSGPFLANQRHEGSSWQSAIDNKFDQYRRHFLSASFLVGLQLPALIAILSWKNREFNNFLPLMIVEVVLLVGFTISRRLSRRSTEIFMTVFLTVYPLAYAWGAFAPGNHQTYVVILLCMPPIFDSLAPPRYYWHFFAYATTVVAATLLSFLIGYPSHWIADFNVAVILMLHSAFLLLWALRYVTKRQMGKYIVELADNIVRDKATGLPTIVAFRDSFIKGQSLFVSLIAIGNFHELSALFGYSISTDILSVVASRLMECQPKLHGTAFRLRGHDFGFIRPIAEGEKAQDIVDALGRCMRGPLQFQGKTIELSYRMGYTVVDDGNAEKSLDEAEDALEMAERNGLDVARYSGSWQQVSEAEIAIADLMTLSRNISEKTLEVFYQPVIALASGKPAWNEALVRFRGEGEYYEDPSRFMSLASTTGHWAAIEDFMFERSVRRACGTGGPVSLNIALRDLDREEFREAIEGGARRASGNGSAIILEILEGDFGSMDDKRLEALKTLRKAGCLIAIDDFGTGYSNYSRLINMPVDIIKFDKSMIYSALNSAAEEALVRSLVIFCRDIGALTVAEGVETKESADFVLAMGFDFGQGYFWSRPVSEPKAEIAERMFLLTSRLPRFDRDV